MECHASRFEIPVVSSRQVELTLDSRPTMHREEMWESHLQRDSPTEVNWSTWQLWDREYPTLLPGRHNFYKASLSSMQNSCVLPSVVDNKACPTFIPSWPLPYGFYGFLVVHLPILLRLVVDIPFLWPNLLFLKNKFSDTRPHCFLFMSFIRIAASRTKLLTLLSVPVRSNLKQLCRAWSVEKWQKKHFFLTFWIKWSNYRRNPEQNLVQL